MSGILTTLLRGTSKAAELKAVVESITEEEGTSSSLGKSPATLDGVVDALREKDSRHVVCICGKSGMGKTTLAKKVFHHTEDEGNFDRLVWVPVNQQHDFQTKPLLQAILMQLLPLEMKGEIRGMDEIQLSQRIFKAMKEKRSLVVLEDLMDKEDWKSIRVAFPTGEPHSKVLITTPLSKVAESAASEGGIFEMKPLSEDECLEILEKEVAFKKGELESGMGQSICELCEGRPLLVIILGKSLKATDFAAREKLLQEYLTKKERPEVLGLCYDRLSPELRSCLLYMGLFPKGHDIDVEKLSLLLAAESLMPDGVPVRVSVETMLKQLADESFIEMQEDKLPLKGMYKSCRLHDQIRDFCISQALEENFFEIAEVKAEKKTIRPVAARLVVYLSNSKDGNILDISFSSSDTVKSIRSLLVFDTHESQDKSTWPSEINGRKEFTHLRVLDFNGVDFRVRKLPRRIDKLVFVRYLSFLGCYLESLPSSIISLTMLETLDLRVTTGCKMTVPNDVLSNMKKLRHLYFPQLYVSDNKSKLRLKGLEKLETLVNFDTEVCEFKDLLELKNVKILAIISQGKPDDLESIMKYLDEKAAIQYSSVNIRNFDCYSADAATTVKKLLICERLHSLCIEGQIEKLPENVSIPPNFIEMEFNGSELNNDPMDALGKAENLRSLVLSNDAFVGSKMSFSYASKFPELRTLRLQNLQFVEELTFEGGALMPKLTTLVIDRCDQLKKVEMPKEMDDRLRRAQRGKGGDIYSVESPLKITGGN